MKKLIALILILVITSFVVVSKDGVPLNQKMDSRVLSGKNEDINSKNKNWEYVKDRLFDGETENVYRMEGSILFILNKATKYDSLVVQQIMKELRTILPNTTVAYYEDYTRVFYQNLNNSDKDTDSNDFAKKNKGIYRYEQKYNSIKINFVDRIPLLPMNLSSRIGDDNEIERSVFVKRSNDNRLFFKIFTENAIFFRFNKSISYERKKRNIQYEIYRTLCYINPDKQYPIQYDRKGIFETPDFLPDEARFNKLDKFLLQKLYSDDFIDQFKDYMYANYPWRYASSFINKKEHEFKVWGVVIGIGLLSFGLILSYFQNRKYKYSYLNYLFPIFIIFPYYLNLNNIYDYLTTFNTVMSWDNGILFQLVLSIIVTPLISFVLWGLEKISFKGNENFSYQLILKVIFTFVSFLVLVVVVFISTSERKGILEFLFPYILFSVGLAIGRGLLLYLNHFSASLVKEKDIELSRLQEAKAEAEVKVLQSQINPHFLYNALNSIASLAHTDADKTEKMALSLSDLFRHSINRKGEKVNTLGDELSLVRNYLEIEQIRFGDRLSFNIDVEPDLLTVEIPMFILQPLVENAIKHGISKI